MVNVLDIEIKDYHYKIIIKLVVNCISLKNNYKRLQIEGNNIKIINI